MNYGRHDNHDDARLDLGAKRTALLNAVSNMVSLNEMIKLYVSYVMARKSNNKVHASSLLGMNRRTLQRWNNGHPASFGNRQRATSEPRSGEKRGASLAGRQP